MKLRKKLVASLLMAGIAFGTSVGIMTEMSVATAAEKMVEGYGMKAEKIENPFGLVYRGAIEKNEAGKVNIRPVEYEVEGIKVVANLYLPADYDEKSSKTYAAVTVAHPNGGSKEQVAGLYGKNEKFDKVTDYRSVMPQFTAEAMDKNRDLFALLQKTAEEKKATPGQISLAWMIEKKSWIVPIPGTRKLNRLKENAGAADITLTAEEIKFIDEALDKMEMSEVFGGSQVKSR